jgi:hypothetical protein
MPTTSLADLVSRESAFSTQKSLIGSAYPSPSPV